MLHPNTSMAEQMRLAKARLDTYIAPKHQQFILPGGILILLVVAFTIVLVNNPASPMTNSTPNIPTAVVNAFTPRRQLVPTQVPATARPTQPPIEPALVPNNDQAEGGVPKEAAPALIVATDEPAAPPPLVPTQAPPEPTWTAPQLADAAAHSDASAEQQDLDNMLNGVSAEEQDRLVKQAEENIRKTLATP